MSYSLSFSLFFSSSFGFSSFFFAISGPVLVRYVSRTENRINRWRWCVCANEHEQRVLHYQHIRIGFSNCSLSFFPLSYIFLLQPNVFHFSFWRFHVNCSLVRGEASGRISKNNKCNSDDISRALKYKHSHKWASVKSTFLEKTKTIYI